MRKDKKARHRTLDQKATPELVTPLVVSDATPERREAALRWSQAAIRTGQEVLKGLQGPRDAAADLRRADALARAYEEGKALWKALGALLAQGDPVTFGVYPYPCHFAALVGLMRVL